MRCRLRQGLGIRRFGSHAVRASSVAEGGHNRWMNEFVKVNYYRAAGPPPAVPETETWTEERRRREGLHRLQPTVPVWQSRRAPLVAYNAGTMNMWDEWGARHVVTVLKVDRCFVAGQKKVHRTGTEQIVLQAGKGALFRKNAAQIGENIKRQTPPPAVVTARNTSSDCFLPVAHELSVRHFTPGQWVMVCGKTAVNRFHGVMARWGFPGLRGPKDHAGKYRLGFALAPQGVHIVPRRKRLPGHMGKEPRTVALKVFRTESARNLLIVKGKVRAGLGTKVVVFDARGIMWARNNHLFIPYPTFIPKVGKEYEVTQQCPPSEIDPFLYPERPLYDRR